MQNDLDEPQDGEVVKFDLSGLTCRWDKHLIFPYYCEEAVLNTDARKKVWTSVDSRAFRKAMKALSHSFENRRDLQLKLGISGLLLSMIKYREEIKIKEDLSFNAKKKWTYSRLKCSQYCEGDPSPSDISDCC